MSVLHRLRELKPLLTEWRRELHAHPQTAFEETFASEFIAKKLKEAGIKVHRGMAKTGVIGTLEGKGAPKGELRAVGLRADIDALDITEDTNLPYKSLYPGKMHACGHDGHTTMLLGAALYLAETRNFSGTVQFIFQPAEENEGGGRVMVEEGLFRDFPCDCVFGMHNWPGLPIGEFAVNTGPVMAAFDVFEIRITGKGTHAAMPHLGIDPVVAASQVVTALQTLVSRNTAAIDQLVVTVTQIHAGDTWNVIPGDAVLRGTVRTFKPSVQDAAEAGLHRVVHGVSEALGCEASIRYERRYPATVNTVTETGWAVDAAREICGEGNVHTDPPPCMGSEDFAFMLNERPGCYIWAGNGPSDGGRLLHNAKYDFNDDLIPIGASYWARLVERLLP
jgi:hippurate hydrolase